MPSLWCFTPSLLANSACHYHMSFSHCAPEVMTVNSVEGNLKDTNSKQRRSSKRATEQSWCLPEIAQWFYGLSLCLSWAMVHLVHLFSPSRTRQIWEGMSCAAPKKTLAYLLSDSDSVDTLTTSLPGNRLRIERGFLPLYLSLRLLIGSGAGW